MSKEYKITTETVEYKTLHLSSGISTILYTKDTKKVKGFNAPRLAYDFRYIGLDNYSFGCHTGAFNYAQLLLAIRGAQSADVETYVESIKKTGAKPSSALKTPIKAEVGDYYILDSNKAYLKSEYEKVKSKLSNGKDFTGFTYDPSAERYSYKGHLVCHTKAEILEQLLQAKEIIDFFEDKGKYAPVVKEVVKEVVKKTTKKA